MSDRGYQYLDELEAEAIYILRDAVAQATRPLMLFSIGKDSCAMLHLARKAFHPGPLPFPVLHVDTKWKFREMIEFRDSEAKRLGFHLIVHTNPDGIRDGISPIKDGSRVHTEIMKTLALRQALDAGGYDFVFGGARRDEESSRAKERIFSYRNAHHQWEPRYQRPELWRLYNGRVSKGESMRVFPLSNWTELDVWSYIAKERLDVPSIYYAHRRAVIRRQGGLMPVSELVQPKPGEKVETLSVRFRTVGDMTCTCPVESTATSVEAIIAETAATRITERGATRMDDQTSDASMELRKKEGYF